MSIILFRYPRYREQRRPTLRPPTPSAHLVDPMMVELVKPGRTKAVLVSMAARNWIAALVASLIRQSTGVPQLMLESQTTLEPQLELLMAVQKEAPANQITARMVRVQQTLQTKPTMSEMDRLMVLDQTAEPDRLRMTGPP